MDYLQFIPDSAKKKVTEADHKFIKEHILPNLMCKIDATMEVSNPFSSYSADVNALIGTLVRFVQDLSYAGSLTFWGVKQSNWVQKLDRARHLILKLDSEIYMNIID